MKLKKLNFARCIPSKDWRARVVFILGVDEGKLPFVAPNDIAEKVTQRKLLYVGMTRAKEWLYLISDRNPSRYLSEIDRRFLRLSSSYRLRPFYAIPSEEYLFQHLVGDDSPEERVRQWLLRELIESYDFPRNCLMVAPSTLKSLLPSVRVNVSLMLQFRKSFKAIQNR